ncbi:hypothetical protein ACIBHX_46765 [Nonomuraea sp. NPDC050536]|uniref:hypothetical protein n=1 Tax=Nonomuraea sp. NPDC050536 TaxID=3364366 RepID=UPI0037C54D73
MRHGTAHDVRRGASWPLDDPQAATDRLPALTADTVRLADIRASAARALASLQDTDQRLQAIQRTVTGLMRYPTQRMTSDS